jgi:hypothetical protein
MFNRCYICYENIIIYHRKCSCKGNHGIAHDECIIKMNKENCPICSTKFKNRLDFNNIFQKVAKLIDKILLLEYFLIFQRYNNNNVKNTIVDFLIFYIILLIIIYIYLFIYDCKNYNLLIRIFYANIFVLLGFVNYIMKIKF